MVDFMRTNKRLDAPLDPNSLFTNQFVTPVNQFDPAVVKKQAGTLGN
jgi:hypothetical protein